MSSVAAVYLHALYTHSRIDKGITAAPGDDKRAHMVSSFSSKTPYIVRNRAKDNRQYMRNSTCVQWKSATICGHTLAVAETNGELKDFLVV